MKALPASAADADGRKGGDGLLAPASVAQRGNPRGAGDLIVGGQHTSDGLAVPHLLEDPTGQEGGDLRILVRRGEQEVPQVAHGVMLHVVHVAQASQRVWAQWVIPEVTEVDAGQIEAAGSFLVGVDGGSHSSRHSE